MKPKTKLEHKMLALAEKLPPMTERQRQWAYGHCFASRAVCMPRKREIRCMCCGQTAVYDKTVIDYILETEQYDCLYCGKATAVERNSRETLWREREFFTILTTFRGYQVARTWEVDRDNYANDHFARYSAEEVYQIWLTDDGKEVITGRPVHRSAYYLSWDTEKPFDIRQHNASATGAYQMEDLYDICGNELYPDIRVTPLVKRNGWTRRLLMYRNFISMTDAIRWLLTVPEAEMLVKTGQFDLFLNMIRRRDRTLQFFHAVRIANRNGYIVEDAQMWLDMLSMAGELGKDTHNPKVVCPEDLKAAHDALLAPVTRRREKLRRQKDLEEAAKWEKDYRAAKAKYFGICFGDENIIITVLQSVQDIAEEGKAMHHCVYSAGYYKRDDCLILSARDSEGNRLETIEVSLKTFQVVQSRGKCNQMTPQHNEILALLNRNMDMIRKAAVEAA